MDGERVKTNFKVEPMTYIEAKQIVSWKYDVPYDRYNMIDCDEDIAELLDGSYFALKEEDDLLIGFTCFGVNAQVSGGRIANLYQHEQTTDIGIGLNPQLTGKARGIGKRFLEAAMQFGRGVLGHTYYRLSVATFNVRAIKVYQSCGFYEVGSFINETNEESVPFIVMLQYDRNKQ